MPNLEIIQREPGTPDHLGAAGYRGFGLIARAQAAGAFLHGTKQHRRGAALLRRQVDIARRHRESVTLAYGFGTDHLHAEVEVCRHLRYDAQLLIVLFPKDGEVRSALRKKFADDGCDAAEKMRTETILETGGSWSFGNDPGGESIRVHCLDVGMPDQVDGLGRQFGDVGLPRS